MTQNSLRPTSETPPPAAPARRRVRLGAIAVALILLSLPMMRAVDLVIPVNSDSPLAFLGPMVFGLSMASAFVLGIIGIFVDTRKAYAIGATVVVGALVLLPPLLLLIASFFGGYFD